MRNAITTHGMLTMEKFAWIKCTFCIQLDTFATTFLRLTLLNQFTSLFLVSFVQMLLELEWFSTAVSQRFYQARIQVLRLGGKIHCQGGNIFLFVSFNKTFSRHSKIWRDPKKFVGGIALERPGLVFMENTPLWDIVSVFLEATKVILDVVFLVFSLISLRNQNFCPTLL